MLKRPVKTITFQLCTRKLVLEVGEVKYQTLSFLLANTLSHYYTEHNSRWHIIMSTEQTCRRTSVRRGLVRGAWKCQRSQSTQQSFSYGWGNSYLRLLKWAKSNILPWNQMLIMTPSTNKTDYQSSGIMVEKVIAMSSFSHTLRKQII